MNLRVLTKRTSSSCKPRRRKPKPERLIVVIPRIEKQEVRNGKIRQSGRQEREERDAPRKARHASFGQRRQGRQSDQPQASDCDWTFRSAKEGRQGTAEKVLRQFSDEPAIPRWPSRPQFSRLWWPAIPPAEQNIYGSAVILPHIPSAILFRNSFERSANESKVRAAWRKKRRRHRPCGTCPRRYVLSDATTVTSSLLGPCRRSWG